MDPIEALDSLIRHPGWTLFLDHVAREWGANGVKYHAELDKALNLTDDRAAASQARQIRTGRRVIEALVSWPADELARLKRADERPDVTLSRRGTL